VVAAAPAGDDQDSLPVADVVELVALELALQPDSVHVHLFNVPDLGLETLNVFAQHHVRAPSRSPDQDVLSVDLEHQPVGFSQLGRNLPDTEADGAFVGNLAAGREFELELVQVLGSQIRGPPEAWIRDDKLRIIIRRKNSLLDLAGAEFHLLTELGFFDPAPEGPGDRLVRCVVQVRGDGEAGGIQGGRIEIRDHVGMAQADRSRGGNINLAPQPHVPVGRGRVPVHPGDGQVAVAGREDLDGEGVNFARLCQRAYIELEDGVGPGSLLRVGDHFSVKPDVGSEVDAVEMELELFPLEFPG
jgi:hypothetical protein